MRELVADVLVLGAGPAGCAAAAALARNGLSVILVDRLEFPREKVCGDALIPDALAAIRSLGLEESLRSKARMLEKIRVYAPNGTSVSLAGECACLPRSQFDQLLRDRAVQLGATFLAPYSVTRPCGQERVTGATVQHRQSREELKITAKISLLATGAGIEGINQFRVVERRAPGAVALRAYFRVPRTRAADFDHLCICYDRTVAPGYGWIFPGPEDVFNIGVGYFFDSDTRSRNRSISALWTAFTEQFKPARELLAASTQISPLKGAPLRTAMTGARLSRPGLLVIGEAAGMTYSFSGEGIGKAMSSGIIAAEVIVSTLESDRPFDHIGDVYSARLLREFGARFRAYAGAQRWLERPRFANFLAWRANNSRFVREQLEGLFTETADPQTIFSFRGIVRSLWQ